MPEMTDLNVTGVKSSLFFFLSHSEYATAVFFTNKTGHAEGRPLLGSTKGVTSVI